MFRSALKRSFLFVCIFSVLLVFCTVPSFAANCSLSFSASDAVVGETVVLSVSASGDIAAATICISYDTSLLQWVDGGTDGYGTVVLDDEYRSGGGDMSFYVSFTALKSGSANFSVINCDAADSGGNSMSVIGSSGTSCTISQPVTASSNAELKSLSVGFGSLSPSFSSSTTEYSVRVKNSVDYLSISAGSADVNAHVSVSDQNLSVGENIIYITVTAEDGVSSRTYVIYVTREQNPNAASSPFPSPSGDAPPAGNAVLPDGTTLEITDFDSTTLPTGFERGVASYNGHTIDVGLHKPSGQTLVWLYGENGYSDGFYLFDPETGNASPMEYADSASVSCLFLSTPKDMIPTGYSPSVANIGGSTVPVLSPEGIRKPDHYLVYGLCADGTADLYLFDIAQSTLQRYSIALSALPVTPTPAPTPEPTPEVTATPAPTEEPVEVAPTPVPVQKPWYVTYSSYLILGGVVFLLLLFATIAFLASRLRKMRERAEDAECRVAVPVAPRPIDTAPAEVHNHEEHDLSADDTVPDEIPPEAIPQSVPFFDPAPQSGENTSPAEAESEVPSPEPTVEPASEAVSDALPVGGSTEESEEYHFDLEEILKEYSESSGEDPKE